MISLRIHFNLKIFQAIKPKYPLYPVLTVRIRGYDYPILESFQSWAHKIALTMDFDVEDGYCKLFCCNTDFNESSG